MKVMTILGARPQFIKAAPVSQALRTAGIVEYLLHTGQHYDRQMSKVFFDELKIPTPDTNLEIGSGPHGQQTGRMIEAIEQQIMAEKPDSLLVYGDTNSTLAGALAAAKLHVPVAHVEAGLRSWNREMPEEHNRVLTDHCSDILFCPTQNAVRNLHDEGIKKGVHLVGDPMLDACMHFLPIAKKKSTILKDHNLSPNEYFLTTLHRPSNVDDPAVLDRILHALNSLPKPVVFPVHPRTQSQLIPSASNQYPNLKLIDPIGYIDMLQLCSQAKAALTDSGGLQKEAFFLQTPCITLRKETEWTETLINKANQVVGNTPDAIAQAVSNLPPKGTTFDLDPFGSTHSSIDITKILQAA
jgi:UDP-GlcNAc3NAcA epimerase